MFARKLAALVILIVFLIPAAGFAQDAPTPKELPTADDGGAPLEVFDSEDVKEIRLLLSGYHGLPPKAAFDKYPHADAIVFAMATDEKSFPLYRDRALGALKYWPSQAVFRLYRSVLSDDDTRDGTRHRVMRLLGETFGGQSLEVLKPYLRHDDVQLRVTAAQAIGAIDTDAAYEALSDAATTEKNEVVLEALAEAGKHVR